jgi:hypothetical protein
MTHALTVIRDVIILAVWRWILYPLWVWLKERNDAS